MRAYLTAHGGLAAVSAAAAADDANEAKEIGSGASSSPARKKKALTAEARAKAFKAAEQEMEAAATKAFGVKADGGTEEVKGSMTKFEELWWAQQEREGRAE